MRATRNQKRQAMDLFTQWRTDGYPSLLDAATARHLLSQSGVRKSRVGSEGMSLAAVAMKVATSS
jgi:hypothetical protein